MRLLGPRRRSRGAARRPAPRLARFGDRARLVHASFADLDTVAAEHGVDEAQADAARPRHLLLAARGLRPRLLLPAATSRSTCAWIPPGARPPPTLLNQLPEAELARILLYEYGEERTRAASRAPSSGGVRSPPPATSSPRCGRRCRAPAWPRRLHVATRTFQAVRMAVNDEPGALRRALEAGPRLLAHGGRLGVIAFHSGEDRIVKQTFRSLEAAGFAALEPSPLDARGRRGAGQSPRPERQAARAGAAAVKTHQRLHREQDPARATLARRRRFSSRAALVGGALGVVGLRVQQVHLAYQLDRLRQRAAADRDARSASSRSRWRRCARRAASSSARASSG